MPFLVPPPPAATQSLGAFLTPTDARASSAQEGAGRTPRRLIDGSGWGERRPGSGVYVHTSNVGEAGGAMWNGDANSWLWFDLGRAARVRGVYIWNYNEGNGWNTRGVKDVDILASTDGKTFVPVGTFTFQMARGEDGDAGQAIAFGKVVRARFFRWQIRSNYRGGEMSGLSEVRFADADRAAIKTKPVVWKPTYPRPKYLKATRGQKLAGSENIVYPADAGVLDVTKSPYFARADGVHDDTSAIQKALDDATEKSAIVYLPNGIYQISDTLRWGGAEGQQRFTVLQGQSRRGTVIRLRDACPGFDLSRRPKPLVYTGHAPAQRFGNGIYNLTLDTGVKNPGAVGAQFIANNQGGMSDVSIISGDGQGVAGLDMGYTDEQGPCLISRVSVTGFDIGIRVQTSVASETLENIALAHQNTVGVLNGGQPCTIRRLRSVNAVSALHAAAGFTTLIDADLTGIGPAKRLPAIVCEGTLTARDIRTRGYKAAIAQQTTASQKTLAGPNVALFLSRPAVSLGETPTAGLRLPIRETPPVSDVPLSEWISPQKFGARANDDLDDSDALQKAIDSGASVVYLPRGNYKIAKTVILRGSVKRLVACRAWLAPMAPLTTQNAPLFRLADGVAPTVFLDSLITDFSGGPYFFVEHDSRRALVLRRDCINFQAADAFRTSLHGTGDVFLEDVVGRYFKFRRQSVWARQFNPEGDGTHIVNDGGVLWILGLKTEGGGTLADTRAGGKTEILGGLSYTVGRIDDAPMLSVTDAQASFSFCEVCYTGRPFPVVFSETRAGKTRTIAHDDPRWNGVFTLLTAN